MTTEYLYKSYITINFLSLKNPSNICNPYINPSLKHDHPAPSLFSPPPPTQYHTLTLRHSILHPFPPSQTKYYRRITLDGPQKLYHTSTTERASSIVGLLNGSCTLCFLQTTIGFTAPQLGRGWSPGLRTSGAYTNTINLEIKGSRNH